MEMIPVESSQVRSVGFEIKEIVEDFLDGKRQEVGELRVQFSGGSIYKYDSVPKELFEQFLLSESKGKFFGENIKNNPEKFPFEKIRGTDKEVAKELVNI